MGTQRTPTQKQEEHVNSTYKGPVDSNQEFPVVMQQC